MDVTTSSAQGSCLAPGFVSAAVLEAPGLHTNSKGKPARRDAVDGIEADARHTLDGTTPAEARLTPPSEQSPRHFTYLYTFCIYVIGILSMPINWQMEILCFCRPRIQQDRLAQ